MKVDKKNVALGVTTSGVFTLGTLYGLEKSTVQEQKDDPLNGIIKDCPDAVEQVQGLEEANKALFEQVQNQDTTIKGLTAEKEDLQSNINDLNNKYKNLLEEKEYAERWIDQQEDENTQYFKKVKELAEEISSLKEDLKDALERLDVKDMTIEALEESIRSLEGTIDGLDEENTRVNDLLSTIEESNETLREQLRLWVSAYTAKDNQISGYIDSLVKMLGQQRKSNPLFEEIGCWYSRTSDTDENASYGLNCPTKTVLGQDNKEYPTMTVAWAKKDQHPELWAYFKQRYEVYKGGNITKITE